MQTQPEPQPITNSEPADSPAWAEAQTAAAADALIASSGLPAAARLRLSQARYRVEIIVTLLAVLELIKRQKIQVKQEQMFGEILIEPVAGAEITDEDDPENSA